MTRDNGNRLVGSLIKWDHSPRPLSVVNGSKPIRIHVFNCYPIQGDSGDIHVVGDDREKVFGVRLVTHGGKRVLSSILLSWYDIAHCRISANSIWRKKSRHVLSDENWPIALNKDRVVEHFSVKELADGREEEGDSIIEISICDIDGGVVLRRDNAVEAPTGTSR